MVECCEMLKAVIKGWPMPLSYPLYITTEGDLRSDMLVMRLGTFTPAGNISQKSGSVAIRFCPFCGTSHLEEKESNPCPTTEDG